jgi:hypothetical protein
MGEALADLNEAMSGDSTSRCASASGSIPARPSSARWAMRAPRT